MSETGRRASWLVFGCLLIAGCNGKANRSATAPATSSRTAAGESAEVAQPSANQQRRPRRARPATNNQPGDFDFYLLTLSWSPEFCATHATSPECTAHPGFVVHGLWPQNEDGTYPENCSNAPGPANPQQYINIIPTVSLIEHEWQTHGTCSGLAPDVFFQTAGNAFHEVKLPPQIDGATQPISLSPDAIINAFASANPSFPAGSIALSCGNNYLTAVEVCLSKSLAPEACQSVRSCGATSVKITPR